MASRCAMSSAGGPCRNGARNSSSRSSADRPRHDAEPSRFHPHSQAVVRFPPPAPARTTPGVRARTAGRDAGAAPSCRRRRCRRGRRGEHAAPSGRRAAPPPGASRRTSARRSRCRARASPDFPNASPDTTAAAPSATPRAPRGGRPVARPAWAVLPTGRGRAPLLPKAPEQARTPLPSERGRSPIPLSMTRSPRSPIPLSMTRSPPRALAKPLVWVSQRVAARRAALPSVPSGPRSPIGTAGPGPGRWPGRETPPPPDTPRAVRRRRLPSSGRAPSPSRRRSGTARARRSRERSWPPGRTGRPTATPAGLSGGDGEQ